MQLSHLLHQRPALLRQVRLANLAFAYAKLAGFADRIARARLHGECRLEPVAPEAERYLTTLTALEGSQSVIEEHFTDEDLTDFADAIVLATGEPPHEINFRLEHVPDLFLAPLRQQLEQAGVALDLAASPDAPAPRPSATDH